MANAARQETEITFGEKTYTVKPTFAVIAGIEDATGQACIALAKKCYASDSAGLPSLTEFGRVVYHLLKPFGGPDADEVGRTLMDYGCVSLYIPVGDILSRALRGNIDHIRQAEEAAKGEGTVNPPPTPPLAT